MSPRMLSLHHIIKAAILFGFAAYIAYLVKTDHILYYIAPRMVDYVKWSAVGLYAIAIYQVYQAIRSFWGSVVTCDCDHTPPTSLFKNIVIYGLFCFPLLLGFILPDASMGSSVAAKKGMNLSSANNVKKETPAIQSASPVPPLSSTPSAAPTPVPNPAGGAPATSGTEAEMFPSDKFTKHYAAYAKDLYKSSVIKVKEDMYLETLTTVDLYLDRFIGKKMELTGFVYRQEEMKDNQFVVGRFTIQCCSADAAPYGVLVQYDRANQFADDSWVTVTGTIQQTTFNEMDIMLLKVEKISKAEPASAQYVYPNFDFGS